MLTHNDILRAIKISQALQEYFDNNPGCGVLRSTEVYEILLRKGLVEKDRHQGIKFREFLNLIRQNDEMRLIPQCRWEEGFGHNTNWYFETNRAKTIKAKNLKHISQLEQKSELNFEELSNKIKDLPKRDTSKFLPQELETRNNYPRAYEYWTKQEEDLLLEVIREIKDPFDLGKIFMRQPSAIQTRLKLKFNIIL